MAKGSATGYRHGKISLTLGTELFDKVNLIAERENVSFASVVRDLLSRQLTTIGRRKDDE